jgi:hypothetical protein
MTEKRYVTNDIVKFDYSEIWIKSDNEMYTDTPLRNDEVIELLNENEQLKKQIQYLETRNKRQYEQLKKIRDLMYKRDWKALETIVEDWEEFDRLLQAVYGNCGDVE